jgi:hypothetical protein
VSLLKSDWQSAKPLIQEALQLEESNPVALSLFVQIQDHERQAEVDHCVGEARDLQAAGNLQSALLSLEHALRKYPGEMRLSQLQATLLNMLQAEPIRRHSKPQTPLPTPKRNRLTPQNNVVDGAVGFRAKASGLSLPTGVFETVVDSHERATELPLTTSALKDQAEGVGASKLFLLKKWRWAGVILFTVILGLLMIAIVAATHTSHRVRPVPESEVPTVTPELHGKIEGTSAPAIGDTTTADSEFHSSDDSSETTRPANTATQAFSPSDGSTIGMLQIRANIAQAQVKIDGIGKESILNGSTTVRLEAGKHRIQIVAPGYVDSEVREISISTRKTTREVFVLSLVQAQLSLEAAEPGAAVYVDGLARGTIMSNGALNLDLPPGEHRVQLKKRDFEDSANMTREFIAGHSETISGKQLPLLKNGSVAFNVTPADATITLRFENAPSTIARPNETVFLKKGIYTYLVEAEHFQTVSGTISVEPGNFTAKSLSLQAAGLTAADLLENPSSWSHHGGFWVVKQSEYGWLKPRGGYFSVAIETQLTRLRLANKKAEWTLDYRGAGNKIVYSASGNVLSRQIVIGGKPASNLVKVQFKQQAEIYHFIFDVSPARIVVRDNRGDLLDEVTRPDPSVDLGKIGFRGEISVSVEQLR